MSTPPYPPAMPDLEGWLWAQLRDIPGVTSFCYSAIPMQMVPWQTAYFMQVDIRAKTKHVAWDKADEVRRIIWHLPQIPWPDGWISYCQIDDGPAWLPDEDGQPRYYIRAEIRAHPNRSSDPGGPDARHLLAAGQSVKE